MISQKLSESFPLNCCKITDICSPHDFHVSVLTDQIITSQFLNVMKTWARYKNICWQTGGSWLQPTFLI